MNIGLDIDDTMTNTSELKIDYFRKQFKTDDMNKLIDMLNPSKIDGELSDFFEKNLLEMTKSYTLKDNVKEVIDRLREKGHKIYIITARGCRIDGGIVDETYKYLERKGIVYDKIVLRLKDKTSICLENKIDIMVDDSIEILGELKKNSIKTVLFNSIVNTNDVSDIDRVNNWIELENYIYNL